ncbi:MAG: Mut7-C RNAse domain-containing protein [Chloroflexi bacterium]|nr:Mut7-C RNAse domain-containing protein [Chloroflexota bacterium]
MMKPRFLVDAMLGRLAKWLRILGYDTRFDPTLNDAELVMLSQREDRVLLTRDAELAKRKGLRALLIESEDLAEQLAQLQDELGIDASASFTRCSLCNELLIEASWEEAEGHVPERVLGAHTRFRRCPSCGRFYWRGSHWERMRRLIEHWRG